jgi:hypothetical protein
MKTRILTSILLIVGLSIFNSHAGGAGGFGIKAGLNASTIALENESASEQKKKFRYGAMGGFSYEIATPKFFAVDIELLYSLIGNNLKYENPLGEGRITTYFHYVNLPVLAKFYIGDIFNLYAGGFVGVAAGGKFKNEFNPIIGAKTEVKEDLFDKKLRDADDNDLFNRVNAGLLFGLEVVSRKGNGAGLRLTQGLTSVNNTNHALSPEKSRTSEISIYTVLRLGK